MSNLKYYKYRLKWRLLMPLLRAKTFEAKDSIFIFSEPRGGSTWLMEIISNIPNTATIFEPFHSHYGSLDVYIWGDHFAIDQEWPEGKKGIDEIINANIFDSYQLERTRWFKLLSAKQLIFKCVMGTSILPWMVNHFSFTYKPIFILRHPLSVASSTLQNLYKRDTILNVDHKWIPSGYNLELYNKHKDLFAEDSPMMDQLIARWCINNHYILQQKKRDWIQVHYEHMLLFPIRTLNEIFSTWDIEPPAEIWTKIDKPSHSDFKNDFRSNKEEQLSKWIKSYSQKELDHFQSILDRFGVTIYQMNEPNPIGLDSTYTKESHSDHA